MGPPPEEGTEPVHRLGAVAVIFLKAWALKLEREGDKTLMDVWVSSTTWDQLASPWNLESAALSS